MKFKYYLRGLGMGIVITATILTITNYNSKETNASQEQELNEGVLSDIEETSASPEAESSPEVTTEPAIQPTADPTMEETPEPTMEETPAPTIEPETVKTPEPTIKPTEESTSESDAATKDKLASDQINLSVNQGESSYTICKKLQELGLITSASSFDTYLCDNGYDKKLRAGNYEIPANASVQQIAEVLTGK